MTNRLTNIFLFIVPKAGPIHHIDTPYETATFGMGCFWSAECLYGGTYGVLRTKVGYSGGSAAAPQYRNMYENNRLLRNDESKFTYACLYL